MNCGRITNIVSNDMGRFVRIQIEPGSDVVVNAETLGPDVRYHHTLIGRRVQWEPTEPEDQSPRFSPNSIRVRIRE